MDAKSTERMFVTSIRLPEAEHLLLKQIAEREQRSLSQQMRYMIRQQAREYDIGTEALAA